MNEWILKQAKIYKTEGLFVRRKAEYTYKVYFLILIYSLLTIAIFSIDKNLHIFEFKVHGVYLIGMVLSWFSLKTGKLLNAQYLLLVTGIVISFQYIFSFEIIHFYNQVILILVVSVIIHIKKSQIFITNFILTCIVFLRSAIIYYSDLEQFKQSMFVNFSIMILMLFIYYFERIIYDDIEESEKLRLIVDKDVLTGLLNRNKFNENLLKYFDDNELFYLAIIDIDDFKKVNDKYGHVMGDRLLIKISELMKSHFNNGDYKIHRWGGEEFTILTKEKSKETVYDILFQLKKKIELIEIDEMKNVSASIGLTDNIGVLKEIDVFIRADHALYDAKKNGKNQIQLWEEIHEQI